MYICSIKIQRNMKNVEIPRIEYKKQILIENYNQGDNEGQNFKEWVETEAQNDPGFFRWLFEDDELGDFECPNEEALQTFMDWMLK